jgi:glycosyltransferase involved in cell wall biosynthesis
MRVLVVHNRYSSRVPSGENLAVDDEVRWLREAGVDVARHETSNDDVVHPGPTARLRAGGEAVWSASAHRRFEADVARSRPDVVHVHNLFPLLSASIPVAAHRLGLPVVWTVHNYRTRCVAGTLFRDGRPCASCRPGWRVPGAVHRCYAQSALAGVLVGAASSVFRTWAARGHVTPLAISEDMARWLVEDAGLPGGAVRVKYNGVAAPATRPDDPARQTAVLYVGGLTRAKGVDLLLDAWSRTPTEARLRLVGAGELEGDIERAAARDPRIELVGQVPGDRVSAHMRAARAVVVPSTWREPFGRVAAEALAHGRPVVTTGRGGLAEIVDDATGWVTGVDPGAMAAALAEAATCDDAVATRGTAAIARHAARFSPGATTEALIRIYEQARRR